MLLAAAVLALVLGSVILLALAPRLRLFDDRRTRVGFLVVLGLVALAVPLVAVRLVDRVADDREAAAAAELYDWLAGQDYADAARIALQRPSGAPGVTAARLDDGVLVVARPVVVAWQSRCVIGSLPPDGLPAIKRSSAPCP
jgi:hypothetical protein